jgi:NAD(P)-dependent dehydrogenase (short-subunit alcohol dehydrogenase family)
MQWTLVTGGALHLGAEICRAAARVGRNIAIHYRTSEDAALRLREELIGYGVAAEIVQGDFSTFQETEDFLHRYLEQFHQTDAVINNVGNYLLGAASATSPQAFADLMQVNTFAPLAIMQALLPSLKQHKGRIVNIGIAGSHSAAANTHAAAYNLSKLALCMLTKSLAKELAEHGVTVNMVSPGYLDHSVDMPADMLRIPMGRLGTFQEVAEAVLFFLSKDSAYITGQHLEVSGGIRL